MLGNIYNYIDLDFKGLLKLQMDKVSAHSKMISIYLNPCQFIYYTWMIEKRLQKLVLQKTNIEF